LANKSKKPKSILRYLNPQKLNGRDWSAGPILCDVSSGGGRGGKGCNDDCAPDCKGDCDGSSKWNGVDYIPDDIADQTLETLEAITEEEQEQEPL
jgi:hypothetical protein